MITFHVNDCTTETCRTRFVRLRRDEYKSEGRLIVELSMNQITTVKCSELRKGRRRTEVWVEAAPLSPAEVLLSASLLLESLSHVLHHFRDTDSEIDPSIVRTDSGRLVKTAKYGYNFESYFLPLASTPGRPPLHYLNVGLKNASYVLVLIHGEPF